MKLTEAPHVEAGQEFFVDRFRAQDAAGVAGLFLAVYGEAYPLKQYYSPEWLTQANASNEVISVVARTATGDIVSHMAAYRSAAVNPRLYELGIGLTLSEYRAQQASSRIGDCLTGMLPSLALDGVYGEAVCNHTGMQKISYLMNLVDTAVEIDLMPAEAYAAEKSAPGRVSCLFNFRSLVDVPQTLHVPQACLEAVRFILEAVPGARTIAPATLAPGVAESSIETKIFDFAAVSRCQVIVCGEDIAAALERMEQLADEKQCTTRQVFLNLADPGIGRAAELLRARGYSLAGLTPRWFGGDGLLLQKMLHAPGFSQVKLCHERARQLLALVEADWHEVNGTA